ncbi:MAG TPA: hypothetical protein VN428_14105 [Bryobacteraceae bacterium]|nr:hypothetical protein [Bryobacteraceae bacterium]
MTRLRAILDCLWRAALATLLALCVALIWQSRVDLLATLASTRLAADRTAELIGDIDVDDHGERFTIARLVASADGTVLEVCPVLRESAQTVKAARPVLQEARRTVAAVRPLLSSAAGAIERTEGRIGASVDDLHWDVKAAIESGTVAARGVAEASEAVGKAAPDIAGSIRTITAEGARVAPVVADNTAAITTDARKIVHRTASPLSWIWGGVKKAIGLIF